MTFRDHNKILSTIFFVLGVLQAAAWIMLGGWYSGEWLALLFAGLYILTGFLMHNHKPNARIFGIIASLLSLPGFPLGTFIGIYGLWYFLYADRNRV